MCHIQENSSSHIPMVTTPVITWDTTALRLSISHLIRGLIWARSPRNASVHRRRIVCGLMSTKLSASCGARRQSTKKLKRKTMMTKTNPDCRLRQPAVALSSRTKVSSGNVVLAKRAAGSKSRRSSSASRPRPSHLVACVPMIIHRQSFYPQMTDEKLTGYVPCISPRRTLIRLTVRRWYSTQRTFIRIVLTSSACTAVRSVEPVSSVRRRNVLERIMRHAQPQRVFLLKIKKSQSLVKMVKSTKNRRSSSVVDFIERNGTGNSMGMHWKRTHESRQLPPLSRKAKLASCNTSRAKSLPAVWWRIALTSKRFS